MKINLASEVEINEDILEEIDVEKENKPMVDVQNLSKIYDKGTKALDNVSFKVKNGEWLAIMGPSGSGKTTLLNILSGLDHPSSGSLKVCGADISKFSKKELAQYRREKIGLVFQHFYLVPYLSALENVMLAQYFHSMVDKSQAESALKSVGLEERLDHLPAELSGGEQQRVCIARALINEPLLLLADEPTGNLDEKNEDIVMGLFKRLHDEGRTIITVTHDPSIADMADELITLQHGKIA